MDPKDAPTFKQVIQYVVEQRDENLLSIKIADTSDLRFEFGGYVWQVVDNTVTPIDTTGA